MTHDSETARYISARIDESRKFEHQIAMESGFDCEGIVSMIRSGSAKVPIAKIGKIAKALGTDPIQLMSICFQEYFPETWDSISPFLDTALTADELSLIKGFRSAVGVPYIMSLASGERELLNAFLQGLLKPSLVH
jgi:hypothetical protein